MVIKSAKFVRGEEWLQWEGFAAKVVANAVPHARVNSKSINQSINQ